MKLGTAFGIDILLHWSFFILPVVVISWSVALGDSISVTALWLVLLVVILASVLLHELGHGLAAKWLGIPIVDIMLTPICGLARLARAPDHPREEVCVAIAGPVANLICGALLALLLYLTQTPFSIEPLIVRSSLMLTLLWVNVALCVLNLLPVFPMDGGRIFRAVLAMFIEEKLATRIAVRTGQFFSLAAVLIGLNRGIYPLVIIGAFLILTAENEIRTAPLES